MMPNVRIQNFLFPTARREGGGGREAARRVPGGARGAGGQPGAQGGGRGEGADGGPGAADAHAAALEPLAAQGAAAGVAAARWWVTVTCVVG